jgi:hypothetical protein
VANDGQIVRNEQIGEAQFLLAGEHRYRGHCKEDEASDAILSIVRTSTIEGSNPI